METKRDHPRASERAEIFTRTAFTQPHVAGFRIDKNLRLFRSRTAPLRIRTLRRDEGGELRQRVENPDRCVRGEIGREEAEVKIGTPFTVFASSAWSFGLSGQAQDMQ